MLTTNEFQLYLDKANEAAQCEAWQETMDCLISASAIQPTDPGVITGIGTCLTKMGKSKEALAYFKKAVLLAPNSADAQSNLGFVLVQLGKYDRAESAYRAALKLDPDHIPSLKNLAYLCIKNLEHIAEGIQILASLFQKTPDDIEVALLLANCYHLGKKFDSARFLYKHVLSIQPQNPVALEALQALSQPDLSKVIDLNHIARPEHAQKLSSLKALTKKTVPIDKNAIESTVVKEPATARVSGKPAIAFYGTGKLSDPVRLSLPASSLGNSLYKVKINQPFTSEDLTNFDLFVFSNPQLSPESLKSIARCSEAGKKIIIDVDEYFRQIPIDRQDYFTIGAGNPVSIQALENSLRLADCVTVPTIQLGEAYRRFARRINIIPNGWDQGNSLWNQPSSPHKSIKIGWCGSLSQKKDIESISNDLIRVLKEFTETRLIIGGDISIYESFASIPEKKRLYLPLAPFVDYPYMLSQFDILLAPLIDDAYNQAKSDIKLVDAGVRRIPWVASPLPNYREWAAGGLFAEKTGDWYKALKSLILNSNLRQELGEAGRNKAEERESQKIISYWEKTIMDIMAL